MTQYQRFELSRIDGEIAELEKKIAVKHEQRRELVNRMGLNKAGPVGVGDSYVIGETGTDTLMPNKCEHKSKTCATSKCHCDDCGYQLPWQHTEIKP